ncbi:MAG: amidohydrolase [Deltaproteobacteria bacterium]|nr:MAG: amidohydrolase [Deltaproteobacteria bacterium]TMQ18103.1 MAG: amidohydrolase [Deltaproteobacteria bacterium]
MTRLAVRLSGRLCLGLVLACAAPAAADTIAIVGATIYQRSDQKLDNATLVIRDGKIAEIGAGVAVPAGAVRIDGRGKTVTAGLIEASTQLGLIEVDLEESANDGRFGTQPTEIHAAYRAVDAYDGRSVAIPVARTGGVTSAITGPTGGLVAGQTAWVSLADGATPLAPIRAPAAMEMALGRNAVAIGSRGHTVERLRELFDDVDNYRRNRANFERNAARRLIAQRLDLEALIPVLDGRELAVIRATAEVDIRAALAIAAERKLRIAIVGGTEAWRVAAELAAARVPVLLDPTDNLPGDLGALDVRDDNATVLARAGVAVGISTLGSASAARTIRQLAGIAVAQGLPWPRGLAAITEVPAQIFGGTERGTLDRGKVADVVVWSGDPLELTTRAETVIIGGVVQSLVTHQTKLLDRYKVLRP